VKPRQRIARVLREAKRLVRARRVHCGP